MQLYDTAPPCVPHPNTSTADKCPQLQCHRGFMATLLDKNASQQHMVCSSDQHVKPSLLAGTLCCQGPCALSSTSTLPHGLPPAHKASCVWQAASQQLKLQFTPECPRVQETRSQLLLACPGLPGGELCSAAWCSPSLLLVAASQPDVTAAVTCRHHQQQQGTTASSPSH